MRLYSTREIQRIMMKALEERGLSIDRASHGILEISQSTGRISQHFKIRVENSEADRDH
jgi:hypothetical protein